MSDGELAGRVALVTGGSRGIGRAVAIELARAGARVAVTYRTQAAAADETLKAMAELGSEGLALACDVADLSAVEAAVAGVVERLGGLDIAVNNAGMTRDQLIIRTRPEDFDAVIGTNLRGTWNVCRTVTRPMLRARAGRIVNLSSSVAALGNPGQSGYASSKGGIEALTRTLARELGGRGITVNAVAPGFIETDMTRELPEAARTEMLGRTALGRAGSVEDVAYAVRFLAGDEAAYITGQVIHVNGGLL